MAAADSGLDLPRALPQFDRADQSFSKAKSAHTAELVSAAPAPVAAIAAAGADMHKVRSAVPVAAAAAAAVAKESKFALWFGTANSAVVCMRNGLVDCCQRK